MLRWKYSRARWYFRDKRPRVEKAMAETKAMGLMTQPSMVGGGEGVLRGTAPEWFGESCCG